MIISKLILMLVTCIFIPLTLIKRLIDKEWPYYVTVTLCTSLSTLYFIDGDWLGIIWAFNAVFWSWSLYYKRKLKRLREHSVQELEGLLAELERIRDNHMNNIIEEKPKKIKPEKTIKKLKL